MSEQNPPAAEQTVTQAVIDRAKQGDREAMSELYKATELEIYRTIHAMIRDEDLVLDVQQDCYLKAFSRLDQLRDASAFLPWLRQIAVNEAKSQLRKKKPLLFSELSDEEEAAEPELPDIRPEASPELALDRRETARLVREILDRLTDSQRLMMGMYYYEQIPVREIADELGLQPGTVKSQLHRSRKLVEDEVRKLEARGVKLYGLSPLPFLLALLKRAEPAEEAGGKAMAAVLREKGAEAVGVRVGRRFFETAAGKLLLGLITVGVIGGGVAGWRWIQSRAAPLGDVRPPSLADSAEDMSTEPTIISSAPTEPVTTEPETTAPVTTEPTEPESTEPTEPEPESTEPSAAPQPTEPSPPAPTEPSSPSPAPSEPRPTEPKPTEPMPTEPPPTEPGTTEASSSPAEEESRVLRFFDVMHTEFVNDTGTEIDDLSVGGELILDILIEGSATPSLTTDNPSMFRFGSLTELFGSDTSETRHEFSCFVTILSGGVGHIYCTVNGKDPHVITVTVAEFVDQILSVDVPLYPSSYADEFADGVEHAAVGSAFRISVLVRSLHGTVPECTTDAPAVVSIGAVTEDENDPLAQHQITYYISGTIIGPGDAHIYLSLNGNVEKTWTVHAAERDVVVTEAPAP